MVKNKYFRIYLAGVLFWVFSIYFALTWGAVDQITNEVMIQIRLPRVILASALGMGLSVAGAALQALFANPLCEPYTLGISSGSALGAVIGMSLGVEWAYAGMTGTAFLGALLFAGILYGISFMADGKHATLLLTGVMLGFLGSSLVALWIALSDSNGLQGAMVWLFGDLSRARLQGALISSVSLLFLVFGLWTKSNDLDALLMGEEGASALGVNVPLARRKIILLCSMMIGLCVSAGGMIGFVGLVIPHFARRWLGSLHLALLPLCALLGAAALTMADGVSRWIARPYELPIGIVTALIGAPLFLWMMLTRREVS